MSESALMLYRKAKMTAELSTHTSNTQNLQVRFSNSMRNCEPPDVQVDFKKERN